jgi:putative DNA primase/helicase
MDRCQRVARARAPPVNTMTEGWERIIAIVDSAAPVEAPEIPLAVSPKKSAPRQRRSDRSSSSAANPASSRATAAPTARGPEIPPTHPDAPSDPSASAAAPAAADRGNGVSFRVSSQTGGSAESVSSAGAGSQGADVEDPQALNLRCARRPLTDLGNAERFVERYRGKFLWCSVLGWLAWDGKRWSREQAGGLIEAAVHRTHRAIQDEAKAVVDAGEDFEISSATKSKPAVMWSDAIKKWGRASENAGKLNCIARDDHSRPGLAAPYLMVSVDQIDADPMRVNVLNGTISVRREKGEGDCVSFHPHRAEDLITKICPIEYHPDAECPLYDRFLSEVQPDERMRRFLHQWGGLSLTGDVGEHKMCFWWGKGRNGKSTLLEAWAYVAGSYASNTPVETFLDSGRSQSGGQATPQLAKLPGVRMLRASEPDKGAKLAEALIKSVTGGDMIDARHLNREFFSFMPQFKLTMFGNYQPKITGTDDGIWARMALVPWIVKIPKERRDQGLLKKICREGSGILNRLLDGLRDWVDHGLVEPEAVTAATERYREESDPLGRFLATCVKVAEGKRVQSSEMHKVFNAWAKASGVREWTNTGLSRALSDRGYVSKHSNVMWWLDVTLVKSTSDFIDHQGNPLRMDNVENGDDDVVDL